MGRNHGGCIWQRLLWEVGTLHAFALAADGGRNGTLFARVAPIGNRRHFCWRCVQAREM